MRILLLFILIFSNASVLVYPQHQAESEHDPDHIVSEGGELPKGWRIRFDRETASLENIRFVKEKEGYHLTSGPAAIYYKGKFHGADRYFVKGSFTQTRAQEHPEAYGLFFGGKNLEESNQEYLYFLVRQDGKFLIKKRAGAETPIIVNWKEDAAVVKKDETGRARNDLEVAVGETVVRFKINGKVVEELGKSDLGETAGRAGLRVNHNLDLEIRDIEVHPLKN